MSNELKSLKAILEILKTVEDITSHPLLFSRNPDYISFSQKVGAIKYKEARALKSALNTCRTSKKTYIKNLNLAGCGEIEDISDSFEEVDGKMIISIIPTGKHRLSIFSEKETIELIDLEDTLLKDNVDLKRSYDILKESFEEYYKLEHLTAKVSNWSITQARNGTWISTIADYIKKEEGKPDRKPFRIQTAMANSLPYKLVNPIQSTNDLEQQLLITPAEMEAILFLLWKPFNMTKAEEKVKRNSPISWVSDPKEGDIVLVFSQMEAIQSAFGEGFSPGSWHRKRLDDSLKSLLKKDKKITLRRGTDTYETKIRFIDKLEIKHSRTATGEVLGKYIAVKIPKDIMSIPNKEYITMQHNIMGQLRDVEPKIKITASLVKFILMMSIEHSFQRKNPKQITRLKNKYIETLFGEHQGSGNFQRSVEIFENKYIEKAKNMKIIKGFELQERGSKDDIYVFNFYQNSKELE